MLMKSFLNMRSQFTSGSLRYFSTGIQQQSASTETLDHSIAELHKKSHKSLLMDPRAFENEVLITNDEDLQFIRSPFYDFARTTRMTPTEADRMMEDINAKMSYVQNISNILRNNKATKESKAYTRYADQCLDQEPEDFERVKHLYYFPRGAPYRRINPAELYKVQKTNTHLEELRNSKPFLADKFYGPFDLKESNLRHLFYEQKHLFENESDLNAATPQYEEWRSKVIEVIPKLNHDTLVNLALYLSYEAKLNDRYIWQAIEDASYASLHHMSITQQAQLSWAIHELKPKHTSPRLQTLLIKNAMETTNATTNFTDIMDISQGFRKHMLKDLHKNLIKTLIEKKNKLFPNDAKDPKQHAENIVNTLFTFASNKKTYFGVYELYERQDIEKLLSVYEEDLIDACQHLDSDHITRLAQVFYILKTPKFENILWRVETRVNELVTDKATPLQPHHVVTILRSFSHSNMNKTFGKDQTYYNLEQVIIKKLDSLSDRDFSHLLYAYGVRNVGNPELHKAFEARIDRVAESLDYPSLFNAIYYMLFKESANKKIWQKLIQGTLNNSEILPLKYYRPFKAAYHYLNGRFPDLKTDENFIDFQHKFFYSERYFNAIKQEEYFVQTGDYLNFKGFLNTKCFLFPQLFVTIDNLFTLNFCWAKEKIAINYHLEEWLPRETRQPTEMQKLGSKVLKQEGWEIYDISQTEFNTWTYDQRINNIKGWIKEAKDRQVKKGFLEAEPKKYV